MPGLLDKIKNKLFESTGFQKEGEASGGIDNTIALGVLLWAVAEADDKFLPEEENGVVEVLRSYIRVSDDDLPVVMNTIEIASIERIDLQHFTKEVGKDIPMDKRIEIIENLFRVACADRDLAHEELETIRKIAGLFWVEHNDFIQAKIRIKKEFGLDTAGA